MSAFDEVENFFKEDNYVVLSPHEKPIEKTILFHRALKGLVEHNGIHYALKSPYDPFDVAKPIKLLAIEKVNTK